MAQADGVVANGTGSAVRTDINGQYAALWSNHSGSTEPSSGKVAFQFWADTNTSILKIRNSANNAWINLFTLTGGISSPIDGTINSISIGKGANSVAGNTVLGESALDAAVTGGNNTAIGNTALTALTSGTSNVAVGKGALDANTTASYSVAVGRDSLGLNTTGTQNSAVGDVSLANNVTGGYNVAMGRLALYSNISGSNNTALGMGSLQTATTGYDNSACGTEACNDVTTGQGNSALGNQALRYVTTGDTNTGCGEFAGQDVTTGANNSFLGYQAGAGGSPSGSITTGSNNVVLGNDSIANLYCADTSISASDQRDKTDITNFTHGLDWINKLQPKTYVWDKRSWYSDDLSATPDGSKKKSKKNIGFLAQDVLAIEQADGFSTSADNMLTVNLTEDGTRYGLKYERLVPVLVNAIKELSTKVTALEAG